MRFPRQEYRTGLPFSAPRDLPDPGMEPRSPASPALQTVFTAEPPGRPCFTLRNTCWSFLTQDSAVSWPFSSGSPGPSPLWAPQSKFRGFLRFYPRIKDCNFDVPWNRSWVAQLRVSEHFPSWCSSPQVTIVSNNKPVGGSEGEESAFSVAEPGSVPGSGRSPGEGNGWLPTPVFLPGELHGQRSLAGYSPRGRKESDMAE